MSLLNHIFEKPISHLENKHNNSHLESIIKIILQHVIGTWPAHSKDSINNYKMGSRISLTQSLCLDVLFSHRTYCSVSLLGYFRFKLIARIQPRISQLHCSRFAYIPHPSFPNWLLILSRVQDELILYHFPVCSCSRHSGLKKLRCDSLIRKGTHSHKLLLFVMNVDKTKLSTHCLPKPLHETPALRWGD